MSMLESNRGKGYRDLLAFRKACELASATIAVTEKFPKSETYSTVSQMRRAALSISSNIAEGVRRCCRTELIRYLKIAYGSSGELDAQVLVAHDAGWIDQASFDRLETLIDEVSGLIWRLKESIKRLDKTK